MVKTTEHVSKPPRSVLPLVVVLVAVGLGVTRLCWHSYISDPPSVYVDLSQHSARVGFSPNGIAQLFAAGEVGFAYSLGYSHARDRYVQMMMQRTIIQGRISELFASTNGSRAVDAFMRRLDFTERTKTILKKLPPREKEILDEYARGINDYLLVHSPPFEFFFSSIKFLPWHRAHSILIWQWFFYSSSAAGQADMLKLPLELLQAGTPLTVIRAAFPHFRNVNASVAADLKKMNITDPLLSPYIPHPAAMFSDVWAVRGSQSKSGHTLFGAQISTEISRLPQLLYEFEFHDTDSTNVAAGVSIPGVPMMLMGKNENVTYGFSLSRGDRMQYCYEYVEDGAVQRGDKMITLGRKMATLAQKDGANGGFVNFTIFETDAGVVETGNLWGDVEHLVDGRYLVSRFPWDSMTKRHFALIGLPPMENVKQAMQILENVVFSAHFVISDKHGDIGYQQSGLSIPHDDYFPLHSSSILSCGVESPFDLVELKSIVNPPDGVIVASMDTVVMNMHPIRKGYHRLASLMGRLRSLTKRSSEDDVTVENVFEDVTSQMAKQFLTYYAEDLPTSGNATVLKEWDYKFTADSRGALLFEAVYKAFVSRFVGDILFQNQTLFFERALRTSGAGDHFYSMIDSLLYGNDILPPPYNSTSRREIFQQVSKFVLADRPQPASPWMPIDKDQFRDLGQWNSLDMPNVFFSGPNLFNGVYLYSQSGSWSTLHMAARRTDNMRRVNTGVVWRATFDLDEDSYVSHFTGGSSGRRFSSQYTKRLEELIEKGLYV